jgi:hypothetical protein
MVYPLGSNTYEQAIWYVIAMRIWVEPAAVALGVIAVIVVVVLFLGHGISSGTTIGPPSPDVLTPITPEPSEKATPPPSTTPEITPETPTTPPPAPTERGTYAESATPIRDPNPYVLPYYSTVYNPKGQVFPTIFQQSYSFKYQYEAVVAQVVQAPLIIDFAVTPWSDSPVRSFFLITVRDNATQKLLAQDGYFRTYSSSSPKRLYFSSPGTYHINMYGGFVSATLTLHAPT